jgi:phenylalanyl-tRNA synthetase alpha chain
MLNEMLEEIRTDFFASLAIADGREELSKVKTDFLGKKGRLTNVLRALGAMGPEDRRLATRQVNELKAEIESAIDTAAVRRP